MNSLLRIMMFLLATCVGVAEASEKQPALSPDSVGVVYLVGETAKTVDIIIVFPAEQVLNYPDNFPGADNYKAAASVSTQGQLVLFDSKGALATIKTYPEFHLTFWCENDGGTQFRPEAQMQIQKSMLRRPLKANTELQGITSFVFLKSAKSTAIADTSITSGLDVRLKGDLYGNGHTKALIWVDQDDAGNCDGKPDNNLTINLKTHEFDSALRCCGP